MKYCSENLERKVYGFLRKNKLKFKNFTHKKYLQNSYQDWGVQNQRA